MLQVQPDSLKKLLLDKSLFYLDCLILENATEGCPETSVIINLRFVTSRKSEDLVYTAADAWNHLIKILLTLFTTDGPRLSCTKCGYKVPWLISFVRQKR